MILEKTHVKQESSIYRGKFLQYSDPSAKSPDIIEIKV